MRFYPLVNPSLFATLIAALSLTAQAQSPAPRPCVPGTPSAPTDAAICASAEDYLRCLKDIAMRETPECVDPYSISCTSAREARALVLDGVAERHGRRLCFINGWPKCFLSSFSDAEIEAGVAIHPDTYDNTFMYGVKYHYLGTTPDRRMAIVEMDASAYEVFDTLFITVGPHTSNELLRFPGDPSRQLSFSPDMRWMLAISTSNGYDGDEHATGIEVYDLKPSSPEQNAGAPMQNLLEYRRITSMTDKDGELPLFPQREPPPPIDAIFGCPLYEQEAGNKTYHILWHGSNRVEIRGQTPSSETLEGGTPSHAVVILQRTGDQWHISWAQGDTPPRPAKDSNYDSWRVDGSCLDIIQAPIGNATMLPDGTLVLDLIAQTPDGSTGHALFRYAPDSTQYNAILEHLNGLEPGQSKLVPPWPQENNSAEDEFPAARLN